MICKLCGLHYCDGTEGDVFYHDSTCFLKQELAQETKRREEAEKKNDITHSRLLDAEYVVNYYADELNWKYCPINDSMVAISSADHSTPKHCCEDRGGKRAREYNKKYGGGE